MRPATSKSLPLGGRDWLAAAVLGGIAMVVFAPALSCEFTNYDDPEYVTTNGHVTSGLSVDGTRWAFTTFHMANWHPLTWLSLQLDASLWKVNARGFHRTNVLLHSANGALLFLALRSFTGSFWRSAAVVLLFVVHPLRTEAVAWVAERKGLLSVFFGMLALYAYAAYVRSPNVWRYVATLLALALSLLSKQALVTFPFLMLVLDWWPLGRAQTLKDWQPLVVEKLPMLALVIAFSIIAYWTQAGYGALAGLEMFPMVVRIQNAVVSYVMYLFLTVYPVNLAILYPHPGPDLPGWQVEASALFLAFVTAAAVRFRRQAPYLLTGWLWYLGTLVPVIGLVQVSIQAYADRYCYFPQIGILIALCWGVADLMAGQPRVALAIGAAVAVALAIGTHRQLGFWHDSVDLWQHDVAITKKIPKALNNLGEALADQGHDDEAIPCFQEAIQLDPSYGLGHANLGCAYFRHGRLDDAAVEFERARQLEPGLAKLYVDYGAVELSRKQIDHAAALFDKALQLEPNSAPAHRGLGVVLSMRGYPDEGLAHLKQATRCDPDDVLAHAFLARALEGRGDIAGAAREFEEAVRIRPGKAIYWLDLGRIRRRQGRNEDAIRCFQRATELDPHINSGTSTVDQPERRSSRP